MLVLNNNIRGKKFKVVKETSWNEKLLKGSKGVIIDIQRCFDISTFIRGYRVDAVVCRVGKTGKFRLKRYILNMPMIKSADTVEMKKLVHLDTGIKIIDEDDLNKYSENDFIAWFAGKCVHFRALLDRTHRLTGAQDRLVNTYLEHHPIWSALYNNLLVNEIAELARSSYTITKGEYESLIQLSDKTKRAEHVLLVKNMSALIALVQLHHDQAHFVSQLAALKHLSEVVARYLVDRGYPASHLGKPKIPPKKEYAPYDALYNNLIELHKKESARLNAANQLIRKKLNML